MAATAALKAGVMGEPCIAWIEISGSITNSWRVSES
jgi:hypothetical protein